MNINQLTSYSFQNAKASLQAKGPESTSLAPLFKDKGSAGDTFHADAPTFGTNPGGYDPGGYPKDYVKIKDRPKPTEPKKDDDK